MNLLLIHNNYGAYSGEESVVDKQIVLFEGLGHHVSVFRKTTEGKRGTLAGNLKGLLQGFYSPASVRDIRQLIKQNKPDAVIIHNLYPYISPAILQPIKEAGIPIIMTIHNFRLICPTGLFMRNSEPCELCLEKGNEWSCIQYNCEQSLLKSIGYAGRNWYARITKAYKNNVDYFACITQFQTKKLIQAGYDQDKMRVIPNFVEQISDPNFTPGEYVAFSGRMSKEKGIDLVLEAARKTPNIPFVFAGTPRPEDACLLQDIPSNCTFTGHLSGKELADFYRNARFLVMASRWYEGFPMTILDASSYGKPTIGPTIGGLPEIIDNGRTGLL
ncbi:glycosyltransferase family 4 protein, partial [Bacteroidales bacterium OttesenSCG-928-A17]|nr:glycosyltransferase family 4 protein [Bacteroidales bacterium OttesenSCG-928-A17]